MAAGKKSATPQPERTPAFRVAELQHMRRVEFLQPGKILDVRYQCDLCLEKSADEYGDIPHKASCPVLKVV